MFDDAVLCLNWRPLRYRSRDVTGILGVPDGAVLGMQRLCYYRHYWSLTMWALSI